MPAGSVVQHNKSERCFRAPDSLQWQRMQKFCDVNGIAARQYHEQPIYSIDLRKAHPGFAANSPPDWISHSKFNGGVKVNQHR